MPAKKPAPRITMEEVWPRLEEVYEANGEKLRKNGYMKMERGRVIDPMNDTEEAVSRARQHFRGEVQRLFIAAEKFNLPNDQKMLTFLIRLRVVVDQILEEKGLPEWKLRQEER